MCKMEALLRMARAQRCVRRPHAATSLLPCDTTTAPTPTLLTMTALVNIMRAAGFVIRPHVPTLLLTAGGSFAPVQLP